MQFTLRPLDGNDEPHVLLIVLMTSTVNNYFDVMIKIWAGTVIMKIR